MNKKQELIEKITKIIEPIEDVEGYGFTVNLYTKSDNCITNTVTLSYNAPSTFVAPYCKGIV